MQPSRLLVATVLIGCTLVFTPQRLTAQTSPGDGRSTLRVSAGLGYGSVGLTCNGCGTNRESSLAAMFRLGGAVRPGFILSAEITGWAKNQPNTEASGTLIGAVAQWYPGSSRNLYLMGGVGIAFLGMTTASSSVGSVDAGTTNLGLQAGFGYDIGLSHHFAVTPYASILDAVGSDMRVNGSYIGMNAGANMLHVGLAASWR